MALKKPEEVKVDTILGLDVSTNSLAWCLYDKNGPVRWGEIKFKGNTVFERIADGQRKVSAGMKDIKPDLIIFESAVFIQNKKTVVLLAYAFGAIVGALMRKGVRVVEIPPITWQNAIGNKAFTKDEKTAFRSMYPDVNEAKFKEILREERKQRTIRWVKANHSIEVTNDNVADAIAVAHVGYTLHGR